MVVKRGMTDNGLIEFIEDQVGKLEFQGIEDMGLYHDLDIYGDDADELLTKYSKMFNVSLEGFRFSDFFPNEGSTLGEIWRFITLRPKKIYKRLTIGDLQNGIKTGHLILDDYADPVVHTQ
jgi:hypothetical protein